MVLIKDIISYLIKLVLTLFILFIMTGMGMFVWQSGIISAGRLASGINKTSVASLELGMSTCEVIEILGIPFSERKYPAYKIHAFSYSKDQFMWGVEVSMHFDENQKLSGIYMEEADIIFYIYDKDNPSKKIIDTAYNRIIPPLEK